MIRALIADDEPLARRGLRLRLAAFDDIDIVAEAADGRRAYDAILDQRPDVAFLDVDMPDLTGTGLAQALGEGDRPEIVFVSAHPEFAVDAFEVRALDYLLKPVSPARLASTIARLRSRLAAGGRPAIPALEIRDGDTSAILPIESIDYVAAAGDYMVIHARGATHIHRTTMRELEERLAPAGIVRIHRSTLVAPDRVAAVERGDNGDGAVILADGTRLRYSRSCRAALQGALGNATRRTGKRGRHRA